MRRPWRVLPPVGSAIPLHLLLGAVRESLEGASRRKSNDQSLFRQLAVQTGVKHWVFTDSGRSALSVILRVMRELHPDRDEVVIPAYTSYSVPAAVVRAGLKVRLCDVEPETLGLCPKELERGITPQTLCVVPNHLYGVPCQMRELVQVAEDRQIAVIEDAAQGMGITILGAPGGGFGKAAIFSLSRGKTLSAAGGGLIGTNDEWISARCRRLLANAVPTKVSRPIGFGSFFETTLMSAFIAPSRYWIPASLPFLNLGASVYNPAFKIAPMSLFQERLAAKLLPNLGHLTAVRHEQARRLRLALSESDRKYAFSLIWPREERGENGNFLRLPILLSSARTRDRVLGELQERGLGGSGGYPLPLSEIPALRAQLVNPDAEFPVARRVSQQLVTLPTHPWVTERDQVEMVEVFKQCVR